MHFLLLFYYRVASLSGTQNSLTITGFPAQNLTFFPDLRERLLECTRKNSVQDQDLDQDHDFTLDFNTRPTFHT